MAFQVINESVNYKSIDVQNIGADGNLVPFIPATDTFTIQGTLPDGSQVLYNDSDLTILYNQDKTIATLLIKDDSPLLSLNTDYTVNFIRNGVNEAFSGYIELQPISMDNSDNPTVLLPHGTNFLTIRFPYPINIMDSDITNTSPFYVLPEGQQVGFPDAPLSTENGFSWKLSADLRSVNIESKFFPFNIGKISIFVNYPICTNKARFYRDKGPVVPPLLVGYNYADFIPYPETTDPNPANPDPNKPYINNTYPKYSSYIEKAGRSFVGDVPDTFGNVEEVSYLNANEILVKFDRAVLLDAQPPEESIQLGYNNSVYETNPGTVGGPVLSLRRPDYTDDDGNSLIYRVSQASIEQPPIFTPETNSVDIYPVLDAYYYPMPTEKVTLDFNNKPNLLSSSFDDTDNRITLKFDSCMNTDPAPSTISALNIDNYTIEGPNGERIPIIGVSEGDDSSTILLQLASGLDPGVYDIIVNKNVQDVEGNSIFNNTTELTVGTVAEYVIPTITCFTLNGNPAEPIDPSITEDFDPNINKVVIEYDETMLPVLVAPGDYNAGYEATNYANYRVVDTDPVKPYYLSPDSYVVNLYEDTNEVFRLKLDPLVEPLPLIPLSDLGIDIGYSNTTIVPQTFRKVASNNPDLEVEIKTYNVDYWATSFDFCGEGLSDDLKPSFVKLSDNSIKYTYYYDNNNKFYKVDLSKLSFELKQNPTDTITDVLTPISATISDTGKEIVFVFNSDMVLTGEKPSIIVNDTSLYHNEAIVDIFGNGVAVSDCNIPLEYASLPFILSASLIAVEHVKVDNPDPGFSNRIDHANLKTALFFNKEMAYAEGDDFVLFIASRAYDIDVPIASLQLENRVVQLTGYTNPWFTPYIIDDGDGSDNLLLVETIVGDADVNSINTLDKDKNFITPITTPLVVRNIGMSHFGVGPSASGNYYKYSISYPYPINTTRFYNRFYSSELTASVDSYVPADPDTGAAGSIDITLYFLNNGDSHNTLGTIHFTHTCPTSTTPVPSIDPDNPFSFEDDNTTLAFNFKSGMSIEDILVVYFRPTEYALSVLVPNGENGVTTFVNSDKYITISPAVPVK